MPINKKTLRWIDAKILTEAQAQRIVDFEKDRGSGRLMKGLYGLGAFVILMGVLAIVAANWQMIPPYTKVVVHLLVNSVLAYGIYAFDHQDRKFPRELCLFGLTGLTLTLIALTGQVFHLNGSIASALVLWMGLSTPFIIAYGKTKISLVPWLIGFVSAIFAGIYEYIFPHLDDTAQAVLAVGVGALLPIAFVQAAGSIQKIERPVLQKLLFYTGIAGAVIVPNVVCQFWYSDDFRDFIDTFATQFMVVGTFVLAAFSIFLIKFPSVNSVVKTLDNTRLLLLGGLAVSVLPFVFPSIESDLMAAATFIAYWVFLGFMGQRVSKQGLVSASIVIIAIRIYLIYLEVFGSMLETGFGLVFSGVLLMGMVWGTRRINKNIGMINLEGDDHE